MTKPQFVEVEGYQVLIREDLSTEVRNARGKAMKNVPPKVRQHPDWQAFQEVKKQMKKRQTVCEQHLIDWMVAHQPVESLYLTRYWRDPVWRGVLQNLLVATADNFGFLVNADPEQGLGLMDEDFDTFWATPDHVTIPHPIALTELSEWQDLAADAELEQSFPQLFRETYPPPESDEPETLDNRFAGTSFEPAAAATNAFVQYGWAARDGTASRPFPTPDGVIVAQFEYGAFFHDPFSECTSGPLWFTPETSDKDLELATVPAAAFSEAAWVVDHVCQRVGKGSGE